MGRRASAEWGEVNRRLPPKKGKEVRARMKAKHARKKPKNKGDAG